MKSTVRVEFRTGGGLQESEKPRWSTRDMEKYPGKVQSTAINMQHNNIRKNNDKKP